MGPFAGGTGIGGAFRLKAIPAGQTECKSSVNSGQGTTGLEGSRLHSSVEVLEEAADGGVALAGSGFELLVVEDLDLTAPVGNELTPAQGACGKGDGGPACAQDVSEETLTEQDIVGAGKVMGGQQPTGKALLRVVETIAGGKLREDHAAALRALHHELAQRFGALDFLLQFRKADTQGPDFHLRDASHRTFDHAAEKVVTG
jgi:hypothetical protein